MVTDNGEWEQLQVPGDGHSDPSPAFRDAMRSLRKHQVLMQSLNLQIVFLERDDGLRYQQLEELVGQELDHIFDVARRLSRLRARTTGDLRVKGRILQELIANEDDATISAVLVRSLCRDLVDDTFDETGALVQSDET